MDLFGLSLSLGTILVLLSVLAAEASNGWTDAPCSTSAAVATGVLSSKQALWVTAAGNFIGLIAALWVGAAVAKTIGTGIVRSDLISISSIGVAMLTTVAWASVAAWVGLPVSKTHSLLAALVGIGYAQGGLAALLPASGDLLDSGWIKVATGMFLAIICGFTLSWFFSRLIQRLKLDESVPEHLWRRFQLFTVWAVSSGHGFNDGLKYVGIFTLVLYKAGAITEFIVLPWVIVLCAIVMGLGTLLGGRRIQVRLDTLVNHLPGGQTQKKDFRPHMGVCAETISAFFIWQTGWLGIPTSTNHAAVSAMAGARSSSGKVHTKSVVEILMGWVVTYLFCSVIAYGMATWIL